MTSDHDRSRGVHAAYAEAEAPDCRRHVATRADPLDEALHRRDETATSPGSDDCRQRRVRRRESN